MNIYYTAMDSPLGPIYLGQHPDGLCALSLGEEAELKFFGYLEKQYPDAQIKSSDHKLHRAVDQLTQYLKAERNDFDLKLFLKGTEFQKQVWAALEKIPYGSTLSYGDLAIRLNSPGGMRAVGAANGQNPLPIILPCHRVIAADGSLGGYTGGVAIKRKLLDMEQQKFTPTLF